MKTYHAIGLMSGSSLDGLDVAFCRFETARQNGQFEISEWEILAAETFPFSDFWKKRLRELPSASAFELADAHVAFGEYMGSLARKFFASQNLDTSQIDLIASHGHTIFHEPAKGFTTQIGDGAALAVATGCTVVADFRSADVALGGQGAPLAPMADKMLFPGHTFYLNLGGIANLTCDRGDHFVAFDVTGANQILNAVTQRFFQKNYDENGDLARSGSVEVSLLEKMDALPFFDQPFPKSLSNQWVRNELVKLVLESGLPPANMLHTTCHHVAGQLAKAISQIRANVGGVSNPTDVFATGGGVHNHFLMECIREKLPEVEVVIPSSVVVEFKEAALMALLGVMRMEGVPNCMASVTGASQNAIGGAVYRS